jgi:glutaredoxin-like protein
MYQAIPYSSARAWLMPAAAAEAGVVAVKPEPVATVAEPAEEERARADAAAGEDDDGGRAEVGRAVAERPVLVVGRRGCCLSHVVKRLLQGLGVNPAVHEVADESALAGLVPAGAGALPAVFVGGRLLGGLDRLMAVHISGELVPILKKAGALWL